MIRVYIVDTDRNKIYYCLIVQFIYSPLRESSKGTAYCGTA
ncbi:hypothetical protein RUMGNA_00071 [Mediterraneibacter gnavus ATCC 29149]|uniref:Uncharacterized protein n=1 Tax=Mediterraneibacter gnavus (strain ATCC 29149 / DSM 114966 / JCM 6515 / VPI C7-9) TaxID=411470 RepID=A7AXQ9_MEDG7|nr:hypothetical protein RUMGNA_00071 [Mediterraneibacter gnavus ATCC 29149]DAJ49950.1 MAG TPA: hypothetical protein [Caudoviricetes sp.]DAV74851.1 MAG TPA: hypothetical protein [Caudoviricetes sp.]